MLSYQLWENALTPALRATYNFPGPPLSLVLSPHGRRYGYGQARNRVSL